MISATVNLDLYVQRHNNSIYLPQNNNSFSQMRTLFSPPSLMFLYTSDINSHIPLEAPNSSLFNRIRNISYSCMMKKHEPILVNDDVHQPTFYQDTLEIYSLELDQAWAIEHLKQLISGCYI